MPCFNFGGGTHTVSIIWLLYVHFDVQQLLHSYRLLSAITNTILMLIISDTLRIVLLTHYRYYGVIWCSNMYLFFFFGSLVVMWANCGSMVVYLNNKSKIEQNAKSIRIQHLLDFSFIYHVLDLKARTNSSDSSTFMLYKNITEKQLCQSDILSNC